MARFGEHTERKRAPIVVATVVAVVIVAVIVVVAGFVQQNLREQGAASIRDAILNGARQCCAIEGSYPSSLAYLEERYGVVVDHENYVVTYDAFASNVMPTVVVMPR